MVYVVEGDDEDDDEPRQTGKTRQIAQFGGLYAVEKYAQSDENSNRNNAYRYVQ